MSEIECYFNGPWGKLAFCLGKKLTKHLDGLKTFWLAIFDSHKQRWMNIPIRWNSLSTALFPLNFSFLLVRISLCCSNRIQIRINCCLQFNWTKITKQLRLCNNDNSRDKARQRIRVFFLFQLIGNYSSIKIVFRGILTTKPLCWHSFLISITL